MENQIGILAYLGGDNELNARAGRLWNDIIQCDTGDSCGLAAQCDLLLPGERRSEASRLVFSRGKRSIDSIGQTDSGSFHTIRDFLTWGMEKIPARIYLLFIYGHSDGFLGLLEDHSSGNEITLPQLRIALECAAGKTGRRLDAIIFDNCWMSMLEVIYELRDCCPYVLGSQEVMPGDGIALGYCIERLGRLAGGRRPIDTSHILAQILEEIGSHPIFLEDSSEMLFCPTFSIIDAGIALEVRRPLADLCSAILSFDGNSRQAFADIIRRTQHFAHYGSRKIPYVNFIDLYHLCENIILSSRLPLNARYAAGHAARIIERGIAGHFCWGRSTSDSHGLSFFLPREPQAEEIMSLYSNLRWARDTAWMEAMEKIWKKE